MASTSHGFSVLANSCIKNPINPKTGLSASLRERSTINVNDVIKELENSGALQQSTNSLSLADLQAAKEEEFYDKLQQLKTENKKTLNAYERLYKEQLFMTGNRSALLESFEYDKSGVDREVMPGTGIDIDGVNYTSGSEVLRNDEFSGSLFIKPPSGRINGPQKDSSKIKTVKKLISSTKSKRPNSAPIRRSQSFDDKEWHDKLFATGIENENNENYIISSNDTLAKDYEDAQNKINALWEDFKIDLPIQRRHSFSSSRKKTSKAENDKSIKKEWRHRITIPEPFRMSIRDSLKDKKKTSAQLELEARRLEKQKQEEAECEKKFKAQPAPSHIYVPLYEEITEKNNTRRKYVKHMSEELLKSQVKPFNFELREQEKKQQKMMNTYPKPSKKEKKPAFKAKPVPQHIFSTNVDEKLNEDEELRKIRIKMRSKELLREASLPPTMAEREKLKELEKKEKARKAKLAAKRPRPKTSHSVPDYDALYRQFRKELDQRKSMTDPTVVEPFELETNRRKSNRKQILSDIENDERNLKENRWPYSGSRETPRSSMKYLGALSSSLDAIPTSSTKAADLRNIKVRKEREREGIRQKQEDEAEARRRAREAKLRRYLNENTITDDTPKPKESIAARLQRIKQEDEAYERELNEMKARVNASPLLIEKFIKENAKKEAERKFKSRMRSVGLNETDVLSSHRADSVRSGDDYPRGSCEDLYRNSSDVTYTKDTSDHESYSDDGEEY